MVLQHLLGLLGMTSLVVFAQCHHRRYLAAGWFCFGLALWDKALFVWLLSGMALAVVLVYGREVYEHVRRPRQGLVNVSIAALALATGAAPLIAYNVTQNFPTFHGTEGFSTNELYRKSLELRRCWEGTALFGYVVNEDTAPLPHAARNGLERLSFAIRSLVGERKRNLLDFALLALLCAMPVLFRTGAFRI
ncbi:MAG: hypothetical protein JO022_13075, partial [Acidobacteriaceae bacterium]|nr:hypothetical protein [Acidobacteriaceae bacterium]